MAVNYSANQYEKAYHTGPRLLQNWSPARPTKERVAAQEGYTQIIADSRGHLLPSVPRSQASPWGSFMGTWQMPLKVPPARVNLTARTAAGAANLTKWIQESPNFLQACNGLCPEVVGKVGGRAVPRLAEAPKAQGHPRPREGSAAGWGAQAPSALRQPRELERDTAQKQPGSPSKALDLLAPRPR
ncbi:LOW QUALITY PROTEIN: protein Flattop [Sorex araneus]|uniref:LOW QUALITY PROTEIN: protein Flattop n=1 Tax=Sorex araneus TaxID=42254 RepID=UPI0024340199|nr:LOW QUALITY PROTEIN: protein Flattop [Sorex araneus]